MRYVVYGSSYCSICGMQDSSFDVVATPLTQGQRISEKMAMFREMERHSVSVPKPQKSQAVKDFSALMSRGGGGAGSRGGAATERTHHVADASADTDSYMPAWAESIALAKIDADDVLADKFEALKAFALEHGHPHVRQDHTELFAFVRDIRAMYKSGKLSNKRLQFLRLLGFCFDGTQAQQVRALFELQQARIGHETAVQLRAIFELQQGESNPSSSKADHDAGGALDPDFDYSDELVLVETDEEETTEIGAC